MADAFRGKGTVYTGRESGWKAALGGWIEGCLDAYNARRAGREFERGAVMGPGAWIFSNATCFNGGPREDIVIGRGFVCRGIIRRETFGPGKIEIGDRVYIGDDTIVSCAERVRIGRYTLISHNVGIFDNNSHSLDAAVRMRHWESLLAAGHGEENFDVASAPIDIGAYCWLGFNVAVMRGVTIGEGCIIGAGSVVTKDLPPWSLAAGNPARVIRQIEDRRRACEEAYEALVSARGG